MKDAVSSAENLNFASKASRWLNDEQLVKRGKDTNWKRQYKLRHNWMNGSCAMSEIEVAEQAPVPPILVQMHNGIIYMADKADGVRAWTTRDDHRMLAKTSFPSETSISPPTSLSVDVQDTLPSVTRIIIGFENGSYSIYQLDHEANRLELLYSHEPSNNGVISAVAIAWPYAVTMTATQLLSLYKHNHTPKDRPNGVIRDPPRLLHSLKSNTTWPPLSVSLRVTCDHAVIPIAYALPTYLSGWTVGIQEVRLSLDGELLDSRLASAIDGHYRPLAFSTMPTTPHFNPPTTTSLLGLNQPGLRHIHSKPTSLSYNHPYLLVSHPDNTLTLYLVSSTTDKLSISAGSRLWGHTSSVSGAHVGDRGKAVSVSTRGDELRVWELEGGFGSKASRKRLATGDLSVKIQPEPKASLAASKSSQSGLGVLTDAIAARGAGLGLALEHKLDEPTDLTLTRGWIGFDDENVVVLKEKSHGRQALVVYDFT